jgi:hypothetical protein
LTLLQDHKDLLEKLVLEENKEKPDRLAQLDHEGQRE